MAARPRSAPRGGPAGPSARALALSVIRRVTEEGAYSTLTLAAELARSRLDSRDRRLAAELAYGTIRRLGVLDPQIAAAADRAPDRIDPGARALLRLGAYQLRHTRVPAHAAVDQTVRLARPSQRGFVNAVLRRLARTPAALPEGAGDAAVAGRTGLAAGAVAELRRVLPAEEVETAAVALASAAPLCLRLNRLRSTPERLGAALAAAGHPARPGRWHPDALLVDSATPASLPGYGKGWFAVQDEASVLVTAALGARPGERVLDACAGPGGKAAHLAALVGREGLVVAADASAARAGLVARTARRMGGRIAVLAQDARRPALADGALFDAVLVDAPCSGYGAARRRPELLWRERRLSPGGFGDLQLQILSSAARFVRPGGRLLYAVCTFPEPETDAVVDAFLEAAPSFAPLDTPGPDGPGPRHRLWPHRHGTDGMFFAALRRSAEAAR